MSQQPPPNPPPSAPFSNGNYQNNNQFGNNQQFVNGSSHQGAGAMIAGMMNNNRGNYPHSGEQMDLQVLWDLVSNISEVQQGIREQTAGVLQRVQMIQARGDGAEGETNGEQKEQTYLTEIASLRNSLSTTNSDVRLLTSHNTTLTSLLATYETTLSSLLTKLRPYATMHTQALESQKAHYLSLLETERNANLDLRLEISYLQQGMGNVLDWVREAEKAEKERERAWVAKVAGLKAENKVLRGVSGVPVGADSDVDSSEDEGVFGGPSVFLSGNGSGRGMSMSRPGQ